MMGEIGLVGYGKHAMKIYGTETLKGRAIPSLADGLKPVQRRVLWSMFELKLHSKAKRMKAARTVGHCMGLYHPHSDDAIEDTMKNMAIMPETYIDGQGNWGKVTDEAAASRYIEARMSRWAYENFFSQDYVETIEWIPNYDDSGKEPLQLPSKTLNLLVNGARGIAVGATCNIPSFTLESVNEVLKKKLLGGKLDPKWMAETLKFKRTFGGHVADTAANRSGMLLLINTGKGSITFYPDFTINGKNIIITGFPSHLRSGTALKNIAANQNVTGLVNESSIESGIRFVITIKRGVSLTMELALKVLRPVITKETFRLSYLKESLDKEGNPVVEFHNSSMIDMISSWIEWRKQVEVKSINIRIKKIKLHIDRLDLYMLAYTNRKTLDKARDKDNPDSFLIQNLKISKEQAAFLMSLTVRQLSRIHYEDLQKEKEKSKDKIEELKKNKSNLNETISKNLL